MLRRKSPLPAHGHGRIRGACFAPGRRREGAFLQLVCAPAARDVGRVGYRASAGRRCRARSTAIACAACCACALDEARPAIERYDLMLRLKQRRGARRNSADRGRSRARCWRRCRPATPRVAAMKTLLLALIRGYQYALRPMLGANCRFAPSCSDYARRGRREARRAQGTFARRAARPALPPVSSGRLRPGSLTAFAFTSRAASPLRAVTQAVMDTQRLILFVVFSFSALLLWEAWQKEYRPPPPVVAATPAKSRRRRDLPPTSRVGRRRPPPARRRAGAGRAPPGAPTRQPAAAGAHDHDRRPTSTARRSTPTGGVITQVALAQASRSGATRPSPTSRCCRTPERTFVAQSGLLGEGMPNHRTVYDALPGPRELAPGADQLELQAAGDRAQRRQGRAGADVPSRQLRDRRRLRRHQRGAAPIAPFAYFQFTRDTKTQGTQNSMAPGVVHRAGHLQRDRQVQEGRVRRSRQARRRSRRASCRTPRTPTTAGSAMVEHYFVAAWLPADEKKTPREFYARKLDGGLYAAGVIVPVGTIAPGRDRRSPRAALRRAAGAGRAREARQGPRPRRRLRHLHGASRRRCSGCSKWLHGLVHNWGWAIVAADDHHQERVLSAQPRERALDGAR